MKAPPARRITLASVGPAPSEDALVEALATIPDVLKGERLALGAEVAGLHGVTFVVTGHTPPDREGVGPETVFELDARGLPRREFLDVLLLVDASYSMRDHLPRAQAGCEEFFRHAEDVAASAGLAVFRRDPLLVREFAPPANQSARILRDVEARGTGDLPRAIEWALTTLQTKGNRRHGKALLLATDARVPEARLGSLAERARRLGVTLHVGYFGPEEGKDVLERLAHHTGGNFQVASTERPCFRGALEILAEGLGVPLDLPPLPPPAPAALQESASAEDDEVEFEIIVSPVTPEEAAWPFPRRERHD